jgi:hypothetical protein
MGPEDTFEVLEWSSGSFFIRGDILQLDNSSNWLFFVIYGMMDPRGSSILRRNQDSPNRLRASPAGRFCKSKIFAHGRLRRPKWSKSTACPFVPGIPSGTTHFFGFEFFQHKT